MRTDDSQPALGSAVDDPPGDGTSATGRAEDTAALRHLQQVHRPVLLAYVARLTRGDMHWAEDIVQETMVRAWRHPESRSPRGSWNRAWLFTVARRITIDQVRAAAARPPEYLDEHIETRGRVSGEIERLLDNREVRAALTSLPDRLSGVLVEIYLRDRSIAETAEVLDVPRGTVKSRTFYALQALREELERRGFFGDGPVTGEESPPS